MLFNVHDQHQGVMFVARRGGNVRGVMTFRSDHQVHLCLSLSRELCLLRFMNFIFTEGFLTTP